MTSSRVQNVLGSISKLLECAICLDLLKNPVITKCNHNFCRFCITEFLKTKKSVPCPLCKEPVTKRSLQDQERLSEIVTHVRGLITAYQEDSGEIFSPPRGPQVDGIFFPCTPEPILSQGTIQQQPNKKQPKRKVKHAKKKETAGHPKRSESVKETSNTIGVRDANIPDEWEAEARHSRDTQTIRRSHQRGQETAQRSKEVRHATRTCTKSRSDLEKEKALLQYIDEGSCGVRNGESDDLILSDEETIQEKQDVKKTVNSMGGEGHVEIRRMNVHGNEPDTVEVNLDTRDVEGKEVHDNLITNSSCNNDITVEKNLHPVHVMERNTSEDLKNTVSAAGDCMSETRGVLELTPDSEFEGEGCDSGDEFLLFQSQEVKQKEKLPKVKLNIYSGKKTEPRSSLINQTLRGLRSEQKYEAGLDNESIMSSLESPVDLRREFQNAYQVKTYSKSRMEKNKRNSRVKQWVQKAQEATGNQSFSESDSQINNSVEDLMKTPRIPPGNQVISTNRDHGRSFDDFGFSSLVDSAEQGNTSLTGTETIQQPWEGGVRNRKKIFRTKVSKETREEADKNSEADMPSSDPYEFKSSQTTQNNPNTKRQVKHRREKAVKGRKTKAALKANNAEIVNGKKCENSTSVDVRDNELVATEANKVKEGKKEKHVRFDLKSPEEEMNHLINKIGEAEDHDFLFSTQEALSTMAEQEAEDLLLLEGNEMGEDQETLISEEAHKPEADVESSVKSMADDCVSVSSENDKSQSLSVVPPTPTLLLGGLQLVTKDKLESGVPTAVTVVPQTPLLEAPDMCTADDNNTQIDNDIHLTDSECGSQMPLPIPHKRGGKSRGEEISVTKSTGLGSEESHISPTPTIELREKINSDRDGHIDDKPSSGESSSTEDLDITPDQSQFEEPNLDLQPEDIRKKLSQESGTSVVHMSKKPTGETSDESCQNNEKSSLKCKSSLDLKDAPSLSPPQRGIENDELTIIADTAGSTETLALHTSVDRSKKIPSTPTRKGAAVSVSPAGAFENEGTTEQSLEIIEDTVKSSNRSARSTRHRRNQKKLNNNSFEQKPTATGKSSKKFSKNKVTEEETDVSIPILPILNPESNKETCPDIQNNVPVLMDSQASTIQTSLRVESLQEDQTLPPDELMEDLLKDQGQEVQDVMESAVTNSPCAVPETLTAGDCSRVEAVLEIAPSGEPETVSESVSLLDVQDFKEDEDDLPLSSNKSEEVSTLESVSILHNHEANATARGANESSKQQKRKHSDETSLETDIIATGGRSQNSSVPEISSAPVTFNLDDSDEDLLIIRRPKRKCFSLDGSPLKVRARNARTKLTRKIKQSGRNLVSQEQEDLHNKLETVSMDTEDPGLPEQMSTIKSANDIPSLSAPSTEKSEVCDIPVKSLTQGDQSEDLQLISTIPDFSQSGKSLEDIFNKKSDMTCQTGLPQRKDDTCHNNDVMETDNSSTTEKFTVASQSDVATPKQNPLRNVKKSLISDSESSDSERDHKPSSVRKGVRAARGLASLKKKMGNSPIVVSSSSTLDNGSVTRTDSSDKKTSSPSRVSPTGHSGTESPSSLNNVGYVGPKTAHTSDKGWNRSNNKRREKKTKTLRGLTTLGHSDSECSSDADVTIIQSSGSDVSAWSQRYRNRPSQPKRKTTKDTKVNKGDPISECQVGISPSVNDVLANSLGARELDGNEELEILQDDQNGFAVRKRDNSRTVYSSSDEEFILRHDDEVIRKTDLQTISDAYAELPQTSSPIQASCPRREDSEDESEIGVKKSSHAIITDSESDDESYHSDQQMNFTSSSAFSSQSEVLTTQQQGKLEKDMEEMRQKIQQLEALKDGVLDKEVTQAEGQTMECSKETPDMIPPSNKTKDEDSSSDGELFLSPLSPSPPPPAATNTTDSHTRPKDRKSQRVIEAFEIIEKFKSPEQSKKFNLEKNVSRKDCTSSKLNLTDSESPALSKKKQTSFKKTKAMEEDESDFPLVKSPLGMEKKIKKEKVSPTDMGSNSRKVLSPLAFENKAKSNNKQIVLITSGLAGDQMISVHEFLNKTGSIFFPKFNKSVTHVVVRQALDENELICDRTLKYFQGVVARCWVVSFNWVRDSVIAGRPVPEGPYEITGDTVSGDHHYGPQRSRTSKKKLFSGFTFACIGVSREMTKDDMRVLVELGGAEVAEDAWELGKKTSTIPLIVRCLDYEERPNESEVETFNNFYKHFHLVTVSREWVLDSISAFRIMPLRADYVLTTVKNLVLPF